MAKKKTTRLFSWNVNGIRACGRKGFLDWLAAAKPDILGLQETRALPEQLEEELRQPDGYQVHYNPAERKGYSGVALYTRSEPESVILGGLDEPRFDDEGRLIIADYGDFLFYTGLFPQRRQRPQPGALQARVLRGCAAARRGPAKSRAQHRHLRRPQHRAPGDRPRQPQVEQKEHRLPAGRTRVARPASSTTATSTSSAAFIPAKRAATPGGATAREFASATSAGASTTSSSLPTSRIGSLPLASTPMSWARTTVRSSWS